MLKAWFFENTEIPDLPKTAIVLELSKESRGCNPQIISGIFTI
jgi:hypothetical protein